MRLVMGKTIRRHVNLAARGQRHASPDIFKQKTRMHQVLTNEGMRLRGTEACDARDASSVEEPVDIGELATDANLGLGCVDKGAISSEDAGAIDNDGPLDAACVAPKSLVDAVGGTTGIPTATGGVLVETAMPKDASCDAS